MLHVTHLIQENIIFFGFLNYFFTIFDLFQLF